jgi:GTPase involved in cell partitioning and DNA repair
MSAYETVRKELAAFDEMLAEKEEWIILTKTDMVTRDAVDTAILRFQQAGKTVQYAISAETGENIKDLRDDLSKRVRKILSERVTVDASKEEKSSQ